MLSEGDGMANLIFTDLDNTLLKGNVEKKFLLFLFRNSNNFRLRFYLNIISHFSNKVISKIFNKNHNYKFFYYGLSENFLSEQISFFFSKNYGNFHLNESVLNNVDRKNDEIIILTMSPEFLSKNICAKLLMNYNWSLYGTKLEMLEKSMTGVVVDKMDSKRKKECCLEIINSRSSNFDKTIGFGDSKTDVEFLSILDKAYCFNNQIQNNKITFIDSKWIKAS